MFKTKSYNCFYRGLRIQIDILTGGPEDFRITNTALHAELQPPLKDALGFETS